MAGAGDGRLSLSEPTGSQHFQEQGRGRRQAHWAPWARAVCAVHVLVLHLHLQLLQQAGHSPSSPLPHCVCGCVCVCVCAPLTLTPTLTLSLLLPLRKGKGERKLGGERGKEGNWVRVRE